MFSIGMFTCRDLSIHVSTQQYMTDIGETKVTFFSGYGQTQDFKILIWEQVSDASHFFMASRASSGGHPDAGSSLGGQLTAHHLVRWGDGRALPVVEPKVFLRANRNLQRVEDSLNGKHWRYKARTAWRDMQIN